MACWPKRTSDSVRAHWIMDRLLVTCCRTSRPACHPSVCLLPLQTAAQLGVQQQYSTCRNVQLQATALSGGAAHSVARGWPLLQEAG